MVNAGSRNFSIPKETFHKVEYYIEIKNKVEVVDEKEASSVNDSETQLYYCGLVQMTFDLKRNFVSVNYYFRAQNYLS